MDKKTAIEKVYKQREEQHERNFEAEVKQLVFEIEDASNRLRELKLRLTELEYKKLEIQGRIFKEA